MILRLGLIACVLCSLAGCASQPARELPDQTRAEREGQIMQAAIAVQSGNYELAESLLGDYFYRSEDGELLLKPLRVSSEAKTKAIDTVALLLWETNRDASLEGFARRYLDGYERDSTLCRVAERTAEYETAYKCWNELADVDRAQRVIRTESALRILKD